MKIQKKKYIYKNKKVKLLCDSIKEISFEERTSNGNQLQLELLSIQMSTNYSQIVCVVFFFAFRTVWSLDNYFHVFNLSLYQFFFFCHHKDLDAASKNCVLNLFFFASRQEVPTLIRQENFYRIMKSSRNVLKAISFFENS